MVCFFNIVIMKKIFLLFTTLLIVNCVYSQTTLEEGFESWPPDGWQILELGAALDGWRDDFNGLSHTGDGSAHSSIDNSQCDNWLVTPQIEVASNNYQLTFWDYQDSIEFYDKASVLVSIGSGDPTDGDFVEIYTTSTPLNEEVWEERTIDLSSYSGQNIYLAFRYEGTWHAWNLDDVSVSPDTYVDGALTEFISPFGVSPTPVVSPVIVKLENLGTSIINDFDIIWEVNGVSQTTYNGTGLNLQPGQSSNLDLGDYNFDVVGSYTIEATLDLTNDFDSSNNVITTVFEIASVKDGSIVGISPEGMSPNQGILDIKASVTNLGVNTIDIAEIVWSVDGVAQMPYTTTNLNLTPGATANVTIGQYNFGSGVFEIEATLNALGDVVSNNDSYTSIAVIDAFQESFEGNTFPPENWSIVFGVKDNSNFGSAQDGDKFYSSQADSNFFGVVTDTIYSPRLEIVNGDTYSFYLKRNDFLALTHKVIWKNGTTGEVNEIQTVAATPNDTWTKVTVNISAAEGANHIGVTSSSGGFGDSKFDFFESTAKLHLYDKDMGIKNGDLYFLAKDNVSEGYNCVIKNYGALPVLGADYTIKLMEAPGVQLASINGVNLNSWEETMVTVNHTFTGIDAHRLYFEIEYSDDEFIANNTYREATVNVVPATAILDEMGPKGEINLNFPFDASGDTQTLGQDDISQTLYSNSDFENPGTLYGFVYSYNNILEADIVKELPLKVWISQTQTSDLSGGYLPFNELTLVFDGTIEILPGFEKEIYIPFNQPVAFSGIDNIVVQDYQYDPYWPPAILRFFGTDIASGPTRTVRNSNVFDLDPENPPSTFYSTEDFVYTRFVIDPTVLTSVISGTVEGTGGVPLEDATVSIDGTSISAQTDSNGEYQFPDLPYGTYLITASFLGYTDSTASAVVDAPTETQDFNLIERAQVEVSGRVLGSNNVSIPLEGVEITLEGYISDMTTSDNLGDFSFTNIYGDADYVLTLSLYGYDVKTINVTIVDQNIDLGDVVLDQEYISPFDVSVTASADATIVWKNPQESSKEKLQNDLGVNSASYTNEPNENVWLGNIFTINDITTLTNVEIRTDVFVLAVDFVSIDVYDLATEEIIASSEPFLLETDALINIDIPNIVVYDDIMVAVHWQNNPESTSALVTDYSDPSVPNTAAIKYPGQPITLLSDAIGAFDSSFHVRINTLEEGTPTTNNEVLTYNVRRGLASEFPNTSSWDLLTPSPVTDLSFVDSDWSSTSASEQYRFAVETIYSQDVSEVTFSNVIDGSVLGIAGIDLENTVVVYPVPTSNLINIAVTSSFDFNSSIQIFDVLGKYITDINLENLSDGVLTKDVSYFENGVYFIRITNGNTFFHKKFIISN